MAYILVQKRKEEERKTTSMVQKDTGNCSQVGKLLFISGSSALLLLIRFQVRSPLEGKTELLHHVLAFVGAIALFIGLLC